MRCPFLTTSRIGRCLRCRSIRLHFYRCTGRNLFRRLSFYPRPLLSLFLSLLSGLHLDFCCLDQGDDLIHARNSWWIVLALCFTQEIETTEHTLKIFRVQG